LEGAVLCDLCPDLEALLVPVRRDRAAVGIAAARVAHDSVHCCLGAAVAVVLIDVQLHAPIVVGGPVRRPHAVLHGAVAVLVHRGVALGPQVRGDEVDVVVEAHVRGGGVQVKLDEASEEVVGCLGVCPRPTFDGEAGIDELTATCVVVPAQVVRGKAPLVSSRGRRRGRRGRRGRAALAGCRTRDHTALDADVADRVDGAVQITTRAALRNRQPAPRVGPLRSLDDSAPAPHGVTHNPLAALVLVGVLLDASHVHLEGAVLCDLCPDLEALLVPVRRDRAAVGIAAARVAHDSVHCCLGAAVAVVLIDVQLHAPIVVGGPVRRPHAVLHGAVAVLVHRGVALGPQVRGDEVDVVVEPNVRGGGVQVKLDETSKEVESRLGVCPRPAFDGEARIDELAAACVVVPAQIISRKTPFSARGWWRRWRRRWGGARAASRAPLSVAIVGAVVGTL